MEQLSETMEIPHEEYGAIAPTPVPVHGEVHIAGRVPVHTEAADFGTIKSYVFAGTEDKVQILPYDRHRTEARILVTGAAPSTTTTPTSNHPANPAAGADFTITVPAGQTWTLQSLTATLVTSATVASRIVNILVKDGSGNTVFTWASPFTQTAGLTDTYMGSPGAANPTTPTGGILTFTLPALVLAAGWTISSSTTAIQAGDQWSAIDVSYLNAVAVGGTVVYLGSEAACAQVRLGSTAAAGSFSPTTTPISWRNKDALWCIPDQTHAVTVTVVQERNQA